MVVQLRILEVKRNVWERADCCLIWMSSVER